jgi:prepilin-type N-terminal cleavage/methylation domain-containing protein
MSSLLSRRVSRRLAGEAGFSLLELLVSVALITLLMGAVFSFMYQCQKRFQSNAVVSEANQTARAALEVMTQEIGQAGYNPQFYPNTTITQTVHPHVDPQCINVSDVSGIDPGDWVSVDTGPNNELVQIQARSSGGVACPSTPLEPPTYTPPTPATNTANAWIQGTFEMNHTPTGSPSAIPVASYKFPYPSGIILGTAGANSDDRTLLFYGDINNDGVIRYVVYSLNPTTSPATTVSITNGAYPGTYTLYNLYRSITPVGFPGTTTAGTNNSASVLVENVLYDTASTRGPTGQPIFGYPQEFLMGYSPNQITVLGTLVVTISVAVNPRAMEAGIIQWYTMATQMRPLNLASAVAVNQAGGGAYMSKLPNDLPMNSPTNYYQ